MSKMRMGRRWVIQLWLRIPPKARDVFLNIAFAVVGATMSIVFMKLVSGAFDAGLPRLMKAGKWAFVWKSFLLITGSTLAVGLLLKWLCPEAAGSGIPQVKHAYWQRRGMLPWRWAWVKLVCGVISIGGGSSLGREGPSVFASASAASTVAGKLGLPGVRRRGAVAAGAAAGLAAAFNTPLAGITFVLEEIIGDLNSRSLGPAILAAVTGAFGVYIFIGQQPSFTVPSISSLHWQVYLIVPVVAALAALIGVFFQDLTLMLRKRVRNITAVPVWCKPVIGGWLTWVFGVAAFLICGRIGVFGLGYIDLDASMTHGIAWSVALLLLCAKLPATIFSYGFGGCGGIFAPTLFFGAMTGFAIGGLSGEAMRMFNPDSALFTGNDLILFASVGMSACFGATVRAPLTALLMIFEMTHRYEIIPALMIATVVSQATARVFGGHRNFYDAILAQDGVDVENLRPPRDLETLAGQNIMSLAEACPYVLHSLDTATLSAHLAKYPAFLFPVEEQGKFKGLLARDDAMAAILQNTPPVLHPAPQCLHTETVQNALNRLRLAHTHLCIILDEPEGQVLAILTEHKLLESSILRPER